MPLKYTLEKLPVVPTPPHTNVLADNAPLRLHFNESPYGCSPLAKQAYMQAFERTPFYPDGSQDPLISALSNHHNIPKENLKTSPGSAEGLSTLMRILLNDGDNVVTSINGFPTTNGHIVSFGADVIKVNEQNHKIHIDSLLDAVTEKTKAVVICNPNNPTGTYIPLADIQRLHDTLPPHIYIIIDSAYAEYADDFSDYDSGLSLFTPTGRIIVTRTFSKAYGLPALRMGWLAIPNGIAEAINKIRVSYTSTPISLTVATAALHDQDFLKSVIAKNKTVRDTFSNTMETLGLTVLPSATNFVMLHFPKDKNKTGIGACEYLEKHNILVRSVPTNDYHLRVSMGTEQDMQRVMAHIADYIQS